MRELLHHVTRTYEDVDCVWFWTFNARVGLADSWHSASWLKLPP